MRSLLPGMKNVQTETPMCGFIISDFLQLCFSKCSCWFHPCNATDNFSLSIQVILSPEIVLTFLFPLWTAFLPHCSCFCFFEIANNKKSSSSAWIEIIFHFCVLSGCWGTIMTSAIACSVNFEAFCVTTNNPSRLSSCCMQLPAAHRFLISAHAASINVRRSRDSHCCVAHPHTHDSFLNDRSESKPKKSNFVKRRCCPTWRFSFMSENIQWCLQCLRTLNGKRHMQWERRIWPVDDRMNVVWKANLQLSIQTVGKRLCMCWNVCIVSKTSYFVRESLKMSE